MEPAHEINSSSIEAAAAAPIPSLARWARQVARPALDRIEVLDILRGFALLGMFLIHFNYYEATPPGTDPGRLASFIEQFLGYFVDSRFYSMFGMLFGVGFAIQLARADARGESFTGRYLRRLAVLAVFGFVAEGVFGYNVLFGYALWGTPLLLVRRFSTRALVVLLLVCATSGSLLAIGRMAYYSRQPNGVTQLMEQRTAKRNAFFAARKAHDEAVQSTSWGTVVAARLAYMPKFHRQWSTLPDGSFTLFLIGMIAFRLGLFQRPENHRRMIVSLMIAGGAMAVLSELSYRFSSPPGMPSADHPVWDTIWTSARLTGFHLLSPQWQMFVYAGAILLLVGYNRAWLTRLSFFSWPGRMALTNYLMQVVLLDVVFTPKGFGLKIPAALVFPGAIALFVAQVFMSRWWLSRFRLGPLEWIWRCVTYWRWQPMRIQAPAPVPQLATATAGD